MASIVLPIFRISDRVRSMNRRTGKICTMNKDRQDGVEDRWFRESEAKHCTLRAAVLPPRCAARSLLCLIQMHCAAVPVRLCRALRGALSVSIPSCMPPPRDGREGSISITGTSRNGQAFRSSLCEKTVALGKDRTEVEDALISGMFDEVGLRLYRFESPQRLPM